MKAPEPEVRARDVLKELGRRRRGPRYSEFQALPRHRQQSIARAARSRSLAAMREQRRKGREATMLQEHAAEFDPDK